MSLFFLELGFSLGAAADHGVSEALYLRDPESPRLQFHKRSCVFSPLIATGLAIASHFRYSPTSAAAAETAVTEPGSSMIEVSIAGTAARPMPADIRRCAKPSD
jgi:hypothetical protein